MNVNSIAMWETLQNNADWDFFNDPILQEILRTQNLLRVEHCVFWEVIHLFQPVGCARNKLQFHTVSSTESEIISLDAGLRMDGIPSLDLWDLLVAVLHGNTNQSKLVPGNLSTGQCSNVNSSHQEALLYVFEDNEAVIKMIIKGRSPTMRHVSRTHRVALDWLFDRINVDPKIQIKYIDTKNQLADILTKGNFTRDEWNHLLCLF